MCGIAGFCDFRQRSNEDVLSKMTDVLAYRGPDDRGTAFFDAGTAQVGLGHRRLAILDLSPLGHQPMFAGEGRYVIVYNGEVYNFQEIKDELQGLGETFASTSDTEVMLHGYMRWGMEVVHKFVGMFAFAIYDKVEEKIHLCRDRAGVKPLYFYWKDDTFLFASEIKSFHEHEAFKKELDQNSLALYLKYGWIPAPHTIFLNTWKIRPGHYLTIDLKKKSFEEICYWNVIDYYNLPKLDISEAEAEEELTRLLLSAFQYRLVSDVPVGLFLSAGIDSVTVAALLQTNMSAKLRTFTIGFDEARFEEARHAKEIAEYLGTDHTEHYCTEQDALSLVPRLAELFDEPFADSSFIPSVLVSEMARREVTVALSGDGGDETFAGYNKYSSQTALYRRLGTVPPFLRRGTGALLHGAARLLGVGGVSRRAEHLSRILSEKEWKDAYRHQVEALWFNDNDVEEALLAQPRRLATSYDNFSTINSGNDPINSMLAVDYQTYMVDDVLVKVDRATMSVSLEGREPLLDHRIIEFVARLPSNLKYRDGTSKYLLKKILHRHVPKELMDRPKKGFGAPIDSWLRNELRHDLMAKLDKKRIKSQGIFDPENVVSLRDESLRRARWRSPKKTRFLYLFQLWWDRWM